VRFSETCKGHALSLRAAANILINLSDYDAAAAVASQLIELAPFGNNGYFLRAVAYDRGGYPGKAIDDYATAIELFGAKDRISSVSYVGMARNLEKLGQFCDAAVAIETWVSTNPARNETSQTRVMISSYRSQGGCAVAAKSDEAVIPITRRGNVVTLSAVINGVTGAFILDTGATYVALTHEFAQKAKVDVDPQSVVKLMTANGIVDARRGRAKAIRVRTIEARDVSVVVHVNQKAGFGPRVNGLLGMSFLSRFNVVMDGATVRIRTRTAR
jgi:clan AA aspartic protease (TIGR02281 family)